MVKSLKNVVAISGATGFVGKNLKKHFDHENINYLQVTRQFFRRKKLPVLPHCFCFVHLVGIGNETTENSFEQINVELTKKTIDICKKSKIKKIIYFSGLGVSKTSTSNYFISKFKAEQLVINSGLDYTIFRPSYIIGKDDYLTKNIKEQIRKKMLLVPGSGNYLIQPISINDVNKITCIALLSKKFSNQIFDLVGPKKITFKNFLKNSISKSNIKITKISLKDAFVSALTDKSFPYGIEDLNILLGNFQGNYGKLKKISGIEFTKISSI